MKVCTGIVLFNPEIERLRQNIDAVLPQVDSLILVDNASIEIEELQKAFPDDRLIWILNKENLGVATALNQLLKYADENGYEWVLTLDQDSICGEDLVDKLLVAVQSDGVQSDRSLSNNIAMISPRIIERGVDEAEESPGIPVPDIEEVKICITSGCLTNVKAILNTGGFNDWLFVDHVDHDMCIRLRYGGYRILRVNNAQIHQEYGLKVIRRKLLFWNVEYHNYTPLRVYYQARNMLFMVRKYGADFKPHPFFHYFRPIAVFFVKFIYEPEKLQRLRAFIKGYTKGLFMKINYSH